MRLSLRHAPLLAAALALGLTASAPAATKDVSVTEFQYGPDPFTAAVGATVTWENDGTFNHTASDNTGLGTFDTGTLMPGGQQASLTINSAGQYAYICHVHPTLMKGTLRVPVTLSRRTVPFGQPVNVKWAQAVPASPTMVFDVFVKRPGETKFVGYRYGTRTLDATLTLGLHGQYVWMARTRNNVAGGAKSEFGPQRSVTVT